MPKSYLSSEPIGRFALKHEFDPFEQVSARIRAYRLQRHLTNKFELLILGGTWTSYPLDYQDWFMKRCIDAMNGFEAGSLNEAVAANADAEFRNVTTAIETRPEHITEKTIHRLRRQGVTKVQIGIPTLRDDLLVLTRRGHTVEQALVAVGRLRRGGFKIGVEWMPNLPGSMPQADAEEYQRFWSEPGLRPDDIKILPCRVLPNTPLMDLYRQGRHRPYTRRELVWLIGECLKATPDFARVARVGRQFPMSECRDEQPTNLYQLAQAELEFPFGGGGLRRLEIRGSDEAPGECVPECESYESEGGMNYFLSLRTRRGGKIVGFTRLFCPTDQAGVAVIRALNVVGPSAQLGDAQGGSAQHGGVGSFLLSTAERIAGLRGFDGICMNSAIGVRAYYERRGYVLAGREFELLRKRFAVA
tara:strand:- start:5751 stop:7001 length:1251 start_codon:yes stop_codon:yes gene_type:complete